MTSPPLFALFLALVFSKFITASDQTADYGGNLTSTQATYIESKVITENELNITYIKMVTLRTNINSSSLDKNRLDYDKNYTVKTTVASYDPMSLNNDIALRSDDIHSNRNKYSDERRSHYSEKVNSLHSHARYRVKRDDEDKCEPFIFTPTKTMITHPRNRDSKNDLYSNNTDCNSVITATESGKVIELTFIDKFHIEYHENCAYDYLEIRDGAAGYAKSLGTFCGNVFPGTLKSSGPNLWLKFHSDDTIEYEGFHIDIKFVTSPTVHSIPKSCTKIMRDDFGIVDSKAIDPECKAGTVDQPLDFLWIIETPENTKIYLNFTSYVLKKPNDCQDNVVEVFGHKPERKYLLAQYCGSVANAVLTKEEIKNKKEEPGNIMHVRLYASKLVKDESYINATYTAFRSLDPNKDEKCRENEFNCEDNTCINKTLKCDHYANCRLKADEDIELCKNEAESVLSQVHILVILIIFCLILSGMSFVFLFKCIRKLYQDHKLIKEHIKQSTEDRLDMLHERLTLDANSLRHESEPRASLERENHANEMFKERRKHSRLKSSSIELDDVQETRLDLDIEIWRRDAERLPDPMEARRERNGRAKRKDTSKRQESIRSRSIREESEPRERKEIRDASVGVPDTKESGCQTRESLFEAPQGSDSTESGTNSRSFSTFGYSGATVAKPSPPAATNTSEITIELREKITPQPETIKPKKLDTHRSRPMSTETTRSAPDVIIVSKPIR